MTAAKVIAIVLLLAGVARADRERSASDLVGAAIEAMREVRYSDAVKLADQAWRRGESQPAELRTLFQTAGRAAGSMTDVAGAQLWFQRWLALEPDAAMTPGTSPKLRTMLEDARKKLAGARLAARATRSGRDRQIDVRIESDPVELAHAVRAGKQRVALVEDAAMLTAAPVDTIDLLDRYGNVLAVVSVSTIREQSEPPPPERPPVVVKRSRAAWYARWPTWAIATGVFAAAGGGGIWIALDARSELEKVQAESDQHEFGEAQKLRDRFNNAQLGARIAFGAAAVTAVIGAVFIIRGRRPSQVTVAPAGDGVQAAWSVEF